MFESINNAHRNLWIVLPVLFVLYTTIHLFIFWRLKTLWPKSQRKRKIFLYFIILLILLPFIVIFFENIFAEILSLISNLWIAYISMVLAWVILLSIFDGVIWGINRFFKKKNQFLLSKKTIAIFLLIFSGMLITYGLYEAQSPIVESIQIKTEKLPSNIDALKIVQISDIHLGFLFGSPSVEMLVYMINSEKPDILVCTGDLFDRNTHRIKVLNNKLKKIKPKYGKFAIIGNHEYNAGIEKSLSLLKDSGFRILRDKVFTINSMINIVGIDEPKDGAHSEENEVALLSKIENGLFTLLLKHEPHSFSKARQYFDLQLSGHLHGGEMFPYRFLTEINHPEMKGYFPNSKLYISKGWGTWGPPIRIGAKPEITVIRLIRKKK